MTFSSGRSEIPAIPVTMSYKCDKQIKQTLNFTSNTAYSAVLLASHTQLEAFMKSKEGRFAEGKYIYNQLFIVSEIIYCSFLVDNYGITLF